MKALWVVNVALPPVLEHLGQPARGSGWWLGALATRLEARGDLDLTVCHCSPRYARIQVLDNGRSRYVLVPAPRLAVYGIKARPMLEALRGVAEEVQPDLIDIHGTEYAFGQLTAWVRWPVVVTLQGFANAVLAHEIAQFRPSLCSLSRSSLWRRPRSLTLRLFNLATLLCRARSERRILAINRYYIGRTQWDREQIRAYCSAPRQYHSVPRILRPAFYEAAWSPTALDRRTVFHCGRLLPYKGTEDLLRALGVLHRRGIKLKLRVGGASQDPGWRAHLGQLSRNLALDADVEFLGQLKPDDIARELSTATIYAHPSHVDNSPNTLAEAMCVGVPCVASSAGGIPSMLDDGATGLLHAPGDVQVLADCLSRVVADPRLASRLGFEARETARRRHDPEAVANKTLTAYRAVVDEAGHTHAPAQVPREAGLIS